MGRYRALLANSQHPKGTYVTPQASGGAYNACIPTELYGMTKAAVRRNLKKWGNPLRTELGLATKTQTAFIDDVGSLL